MTSLKPCSYKAKYRQNVNPLDTIEFHAMAVGNGFLTAKLTAFGITDSSGCLPRFDDGWRAA